ncbi:hypothetical protein [Paenibacillus gorillae]|uniref:hypothetical protein n=1 Tax=Paenibacillus gorillae TaxID=1243662 RepID=UPI0005A9856D|nr:hypothetical protein [Paenibacillus gorillae]
MKKIVLILLIACFSFSTHAFAAYTATSHELTVYQPAQYKLNAAVWSGTNDTVVLSLYSKSPLGQLTKVFSTTVNITPSSSPVDISVGYLAPGTYILKGDFQGSSGGVEPASLHQVY